LRPHSQSDIPCRVLRISSRQVIATVDPFGDIKIFRWPINVGSHILDKSPKRTGQSNEDSEIMLATGEEPP
ncbi:hypothetical protein, partial [Geoalkalibacter sp.]|uniref:hypothetical protein n=1 Tax=Geoalkalibacter sp. TaxID=3041440 RepID=UPI00272EC61E